MEACPPNTEPGKPPAPNPNLELGLLDFTYRIQQVKTPRAMVSDMAVFNIDPPILYSRYSTGSVELNDPRPIMRAVNAGQLFAAAFVVLDRIVEWLFALAGEKIPYQFALKSTQVGGLSKDKWPSLLRENSWLTEPLFALYSRLYPVRNTMVHGGSDYGGAGGAITVKPKSREGEAPQEPITLTPDDLREFAELVVVIFRCTTDVWQFDSYQEKRLRYSLCHLAPLHRVQVVPQLWPSHFHLVAIADCDTESFIEVELLRKEVQDFFLRYHDPVLHLWVFVIDGTSDPQIRYFTPDELEKVPSRLNLTSVLSRPPCEAPKGHRVDIAEENERYRLKVSAKRVDT